MCLNNQNERILKVYDDIKNILEQKGLNVDIPTYATNPRKLGNIGLRCSSEVITNEYYDDEGWIALRPNSECIDIIPPSYELNRYSIPNGCYNKELIQLLNDVVYDYFKDNKEYLLNNDETYISNMNELLNKLELVLCEIKKHKGIELLTTHYHKNYIELKLAKRFSSYSKIIYGEDFSILLTKSKRITKKRKVNYIIEVPDNTEYIYIIKNKRKFDSRKNNSDIAKAV